TISPLSPFPPVQSLFKCAARTLKELPAGRRKPAADLAFVALAQNDHRIRAVAGHGNLRLDLRISSFAQWYYVGLRDYLASAYHCCSHAINTVGCPVGASRGGIVEHQTLHFHLEVAIPLQFSFARRQLPDLAAGGDVAYCSVGRRACCELSFKLFLSHFGTA